MTTATIFIGLYQGVIGAEEDATLVAVFSSKNQALRLRNEISDSHTDLKRAANEARQTYRQETAEVPDLYWDFRPVSFDPRSIEELL